MSERDDMAKAEVDEDLEAEVERLRGELDEARAESRDLERDGALVEEHNAALRSRVAALETALRPLISLLNPSWNEKGGEWSYSVPAVGHERWGLWHAAFVKMLDAYVLAGSASETQGGEREGEHEEALSRYSSDYLARPVKSAEAERDRLAAENENLREAVRIMNEQSPVEEAARLTAENAELRERVDFLEESIGERNAAEQELRERAEKAERERDEARLRRNRARRQREDIRCERDAAQADAARLRGAVERLLGENLREDCFATYFGGYSTKHDIDVFQHGMDTVCNVVASSLRAALGSARAGEPTRGSSPATPATPPRECAVPGCDLVASLTCHEHFGAAVRFSADEPEPEESDVDAEDCGAERAAIRGLESRMAEVASAALPHPDIHVAVGPEAVDRVLMRAHAEMARHKHWCGRAHYLGEYVPCRCDRPDPDAGLATPALALGTASEQWDELGPTTVELYALHHGISIEEAGKRCPFGWEPPPAPPAPEEGASTDDRIPLKDFSAGLALVNEWTKAHGGSTGFLIDLAYRIGRALASSSPPSPPAPDETEVDDSAPPSLPIPAGTDVEWRATRFGSDNISKVYEFDTPPSAERIRNLIQAGWRVESRRVTRSAWAPAEEPSDA